MFTDVDRVPVLAGKFILVSKWFCLETGERARTDTRVMPSDIVPKLQTEACPMGTDVPNTITWDSYLGSQYCFVSNECITILSYFSHQWPRDQQTFYINSQVVNSADLVDQVICLNYSTRLCGLKAATDNIQLNKCGFVPIKFCKNRPLDLSLELFFIQPHLDTHLVDGFEGGQKGGSCSLNLSGTRAFAHSLQFLWAQ